MVPNGLSRLIYSWDPYYSGWMRRRVLLLVVLEHACESRLQLSEVVVSGAFSP